MAKIAAELDRALAGRAVEGGPGRATPRVLAQGEGWAVNDVICTSGPQDRPFEEQHRRYSITLVVAGSFQYRSPLGEALMVPGSVMLGNAGQCFECGHEHAAGDRCVSFAFTPDYFERLVADAGGRGPQADFRTPHLPPVAALSPLAASVARGLTTENTSWEELGVTVAVSVLRLVRGISLGQESSPPAVIARVTRAVRRIHRDLSADLTLGRLAKDAGLSSYHFLRTFARLTGVTPHQYVLRARLREAALRLAVDPDKVLDIAFDCGFGDVSNFNRAFRNEFRQSPRRYRNIPFRPTLQGD